MGVHTSFCQLQRSCFPPVATRCITLGENAKTKKNVIFGPKQFSFVVIRFRIWSHMVKSDWKQKSEKLCAFSSPPDTNATVSAKQVVSWTEVSTGLCSTCRVEDVCDEHCNVARPIAWAKNSPQANLIVQQMVFGNLDFRSARKPNYHIYINCFCSKCYTTNSGVSVSWTSSFKKFRH